MKKVIFRLLLCCIFSIGTSYLKAQSWEKIYTGFNYILRGIEFPGGQSQVGFAAGESVTYMGDGIVIKTTNGGTNWSQLWTGAGDGLEGISFPDMNTGYVGGWSGYFAKTTDGGVTWTPQSPGPDIYYYTDVVFKDANHGIATAQTNSGFGVYSTSDGGSTWITATGVTGVPYGACYVTGNTYFLVTNGGDIQKSTDNGLTWATVDAAGGLLLGIDFYNANIGIAAGEDGRILKTYDGGTTWQQQVIALGQPLWHDFAWASQNEVYACGTPEFIYKSTDGGATWIDDYPQSTYDPALYEILFTTDGTGYICGSQGWFYRKAPQVTAGFTASTSSVCVGGNIQFTDQSIGSPSSWNWTFAGGSPPTSTLQNPLVTYSTPGTYGVTLVVTKGTTTSTLNNPGMIRVDSPITATPIQPAGQTELCGQFTYTYTTTAVPNAISYSWTANPAIAGAISGTDTTGSLVASNTWEGDFSITVTGTNTCGTSPSSPPIACNLHHQPVQYYLFAGGGYCPGQAGYEIRLEDSETGVSYELFDNGTITGTILPGTGNELSFGLHTAGNYTVTGSTSSCSASMNGIAQIYVINIPGQAATPSGPTSPCSSDVSIYTGSFPTDATDLVWTLSPPEAGTITASGFDASITWSGTFSGPVLLGVTGQNECGPGQVSSPLSILVSPTPAPEAGGPVSVCALETDTYSLPGTTGSTYNWTITGGTIGSGQGTSNISVNWGSAGNGTVQVTEINAEGCNGVSPVMNVTISVCTRLADNIAAGFSVYPNPASDKLVITADAPSQVKELSIIDLTGRVIVTQSNSCASCTNFTVDVSTFNAGIYFIQVKTANGELITRKISVTHN